MRVDATKTIGWFGAFRDLLRIDAERALMESVKAATDMAAGHPSLFKPRTGRLQRSFQFRRVGGGSNVLAARMQANASIAPYAGYVAFGTRPHIIRAVRAKCLRFVQHGRVVFRQSVHHPGTSPRPFFNQAALHGEALLWRSLTDAVHRRLAA